MTDHAQTRFWSGIDIPKVLAGTLAAVSAAVVGSFLGVAGTLIGAAVASLISSIGTEVYHRSISKGTKTLQSAFVTAPAAVGTPEVAAAHEPPSDVTEEETVRPAEKRQIHWKRVSLVAAALFVVALGTLTAVELMAGKTAADAVSGRDGGSPTLFNVSDDTKDEDKGTPEQTAPASEAPQDDSTEPTAEPTTTAETTEPTTEPTGEVTEAPAPVTEAPTGDTGTEPAEDQEQAPQEQQQQQEEGAVGGR